MNCAELILDANVPLIDLHAAVVGLGTTLGPGSDTWSQTTRINFANVHRRVIAVFLEGHFPGVSNGIHARRESVLLGLALQLARRFFFGS